MAGFKKKCVPAERETENPSYYVRIYVYVMLFYVQVFGKCCLQRSNVRTNVKQQIWVELIDSYLFVHSYVAVLKAQFAENVHFVLSSAD